MTFSGLLKKFNNVYGYAAFIILGAAIVFLRKPETLLHAQLWAEDGKVWFPQAYNIGAFKSLLIPDGGYFQTFSRLVAALSLLIPFKSVPLFFNTFEFLLQLSPALFFLTGRFQNIIPKIEARLLLAVLYLLLPNTAEIDGHLTSCQWYLAMLGFLVIVAEPAARNKMWQIFDYTILLLSGLTGTFAIFLTPLAGVLWLKTRSRQSLLKFGLILATAVLQASSVFFFSHENRVHVLSRLTPETVFAIFSRQIVFGVIGGSRGYVWLLDHFSFALPVVSFVSLMSIGLIVYALIKSPLALKLFLVFGLMVFFASLITPTKAALSSDILKILSRSTDGVRYWFVPMLSFISALVWGLSRSNPVIIRGLAAIILGASVFGIVMDFRHQPYPDYHYGAYARQFSALAKGSYFTIPITPPGWQMELVKR